MLSHELQERSAERLRLSGRYAAAARRAPDGRLFPPRARHRSRRCAGRCAAAPLPLGPNLVRSADGIRFVDRRAAAGRPETWLALFQAAIDQGCAVAGRRPRLRPAERRPLHGRGILPDRRAHATRCCTSSSRAPGSTRGCRRCTTPGCSARCCRSSRRINCRVVRDFYHKYTVDEHTLLTIRNLERLIEAGARAPAFRAGCSASSTRRSCWCWRCSTTTSASGHDDDHARRERPDGARRCAIASTSTTRRRDRRVPGRAAPEDVGRRVPPRHRGSRDRPPVRRASSASRSGSRCSA